MALRDEDVPTVVHGESFGDRFQIVREAGSGGMGTVFEAIDQQTGKRVALKVVASAGDRARFRAEAEILETLEHPGIVDYVCHGVTRDGHPYLAMEWLVGESLGKRLARGKLSIAEAVTLGERLAGALAHAHAHHVVHRDLKPSNIYLVDGLVDRARVIDFGVAKSEDRDLTVTGQMVGTPGYMAPEQVRGEKTVDHRADVFALGCVLYETLVGTAPYEGGEVMEVISRLLLDKPARIEDVVPDVPPRVVHLIDAMLVKDKTRRLADIGIARDELAAISRLHAAGDVAALAVRSPAVPIPPDEVATVGRPQFVLHPDAKGATRRERPSARRVARSSKLWFLLALVGAMLGGGVGVYLVIGGGDPKPVVDQHPAPPAPAPPPVCTRDSRTGCGTLCEAGDANACVLHADGLFAGKPSKANRKAAAVAYQRACDLGLDLACRNGASQLLHDGHTSEADVAYAMLEKGCARNDAESCLLFGHEFRQGNAWDVTGEGDYESAYGYVGQSCNLDDPSGCTTLAEMIHNREGVHEQRKAASAVLAAACKRGIREGCPKR